MAPQVHSTCGSGAPQGFNIEKKTYMRESNIRTISFCLLSLFDLA